VRGKTIAKHFENCQISHTEYFVYEGTIFAKDYYRNGDEGTPNDGGNRIYVEDPVGHNAIKLREGNCRWCNAAMPQITSRDNNRERVLEPIPGTRRESGGALITLAARPRVGS
jgi:hypothetical protein